MTVAEEIKRNGNGWERIHIINAEAGKVLFGGNFKVFMNAMKGTEASLKKQADSFEVYNTVSNNDKDLYLFTHDDFIF